MAEYSLSYAVAETPWRYWEFKNHFLGGFVIAIISTLLSYQLNSIVFDAILGTKPNQVSAVKDFQTLLLVRQSSPIAISNAVLRRDWITRRYFKRDFSADSTIVRDEQKIRSGVILRLFILLFSAPLINVFTVIVLLERTKNISFADAGFGVSLGINEDLSVAKSEPMTEVCRTYPLDLIMGDTPEAKFYICTIFGNAYLRKKTNTISVRIWTLFTGQVSVFMTHGTIRSSVHTKLWMRSDELLPRQVVASLTAERLFLLINHGMNMGLSACGREELAEQIPQNSTNNGQLLDVWKEYDGTCSIEDSEILISNTLHELEKFFTVIPSDNTMVTSPTENVHPKDPNPNFESVSKVTLLTRRRRYVGLTYLAIAALLTLVARGFCTLYFNNDVSDGIEQLIKERFGFQHCQSLLSNGNFTIPYSSPPGKYILVKAPEELGN